MRTKSSRTGNIKEQITYFRRFSKSWCLFVNEKFSSPYSVVMASAGNLQPMPPFDPKMDISTVAQRWQQWLKRFKRYLLAMDIKSKARQRAMPLYAARPEVEPIFDTLPDNGDDDDFDTACEKLNEYFSPSKTVAFEVYKFRQARQHELENEMK